MSVLRQSLPRLFRHYLAAVQRFTRLRPLGPGAAETVPEEDAAAHWPGIGWLVGVGACVVFSVVSLALPNGPLTGLAAALGAVALACALTGGEHEAALWRSMARPEASGQLPVTPVLCLALLFAARLVLLALLAHESPAAVLTALFASHVVSRFLPLLLPAPALGRAAALPRGELNLAGAWCVVPLGLMALAHGPAFPLVAVAASGGVLYLLRRLPTEGERAPLSFDRASLAQPWCEAAFLLGAAIGLGPA